MVDDTFQYLYGDIEEYELVKVYLSEVIHSIDWNILEEIFLMWEYLLYVEEVELEIENVEVDCFEEDEELFYQWFVNVEELNRIDVECKWFSLVDCHQVISLMIQKFLKTFTQHDHIIIETVIKNYEQMVKEGKSDVDIGIIAAKSYTNYLKNSLQ